jgi:hypothetical protein
LTKPLTTVSLNRRMSHEVFSLYFPNLCMVLIGLYHPYWNNGEQHQKEISNILEIVDWTKTNKNPNIKVVVTGDFNDLRLHLGDLDLVNVVNLPTRKNNALDLILTNIPSLYNNPQKITKLDTSDHDMVLCCPKTVVRGTTEVLHL